MPLAILMYGVVYLKRAKLTSSVDVRNKATPTYVRSCLMGKNPIDSC